MARRKPRPEEPQRELTRKEHRIHARDRERNRRIMTGAGIALGLALLLVIAGLVSEFVIRPNSVVAKVGDTELITRDFWERSFLEQNRLQNQMLRMAQLEQQFGNQGFFTAQINQLQGTLSSPFTLGVEVLDRMIHEEVVRQKAAERGITVSDAEIEEALREEVAAQRGAVTLPQATATAEALVGATATAESWTPTPTATVDASGSVTATATPIPTPLPPPTSTILTDADYATGLEELETNLSDIAGMTMEEYRKIVEVRLLEEKLTEIIGAEQVPATEEQVHARHILLEVSEPITPTADISATDEITDEVSAEAASEITEGAEITATEEMTGDEAPAEEEAVGEDATEEEAAAEEAEEADESAAEIAESEEATGTVESTQAVTATTEVAATDEITASDEVMATDEVTATAEVTGTGEITDTAGIIQEPVARDEAEALALALELRQRLLDGEDFAALAAEYSQDTTNNTTGGDLGWFGHGAMVAPFEEAAFSLEIGAISEPIRTEFGYHLIEVLEKDAERPKDETTLESERLTAFNTWIEEQIAATPIERSDIVSKLPRNLNPVLPQVAPAAATVAPEVPVTQ